MTLFIDGEPASPEQLAQAALVNYGAYTSFRVEGGGVRGLGHHLARLEAAGRELFGDGVGEERLRDLMRRALDGRTDAWLRLSLISSHISPRDPTWRGAPGVMIGVFDPPAPLADRPWRIRPQVHQRFRPHLKSLATLDLLLSRREARAAGFDDALFMDANGVISEGATWNIGFVSSETIVWPQAPMLAGVTQAVLSEGLSAQGARQETRPVTLGDLAAFDAAFLCNSATPACAIAAIGDIVLDAERAPLDRLRAAWTAAPAHSI